VKNVSQLKFVTSQKRRLPAGCRRSVETYYEQKNIFARFRFHFINQSFRADGDLSKAAAGNFGRSERSGDSVNFNQSGEG